MSGLRSRIHALSWDLRSRRWGSWFSDQERANTVAEHIDWFVERSGPPPARVLDVGCGTGDYALALARRGFSVVGCDFSAGMLARARANAEFGVRCVFRQADFNRGLRAHDGSFDHAVSIWALQHAADPGAVVSEIARILRPGGVLLAVVPVSPWERTYAGRRQRSRLRRRARQALRRVPGVVRKGRRFSPRGFAELLASEGFEVLEQRPTRRYTQVVARLVLRG